MSKTQRERQPRRASPAGPYRSIRGRAVLAVCAGGCVGGGLRYSLGLAIPDSPHSVPWATLAANVTGCFVLALLLTVLEATDSPARHIREFVGVGVLGSFTTFSGWMVQVDQRVDAQDYWISTGYLVSNLVGGMTAAVVGVATGRVLAQRLR